MNPYIQAQLKELDKLVRRQYKERERKTAALESFQDGFRGALFSNYKDKFPQSWYGRTHGSSDYNAPFLFGVETGNAFGRLEAEGAAEVFDAEISKRKSRLTKTTTQRLGDFLSELINKHGVRR